MFYYVKLWVKGVLKACRFSIPIDKMILTITDDFSIDISKVMNYLSWGLFIWMLVFDVITPFTMPYSFIDTIIFLFVEVAYTVFLWSLIKYKTFNYGWFCYSLLGMGFLIWHLPADMIQPQSNVVKHVYAIVDILLGVHTGFYNVLGFSMISKRLLYLIRK